eukprot:Skav224441  [mRNA]  locus=scaffold3543:1565:2383:+ [translate_table: standard]
MPSNFLSVDALPKEPSYVKVQIQLPNDTEEETLLPVQLPYDVVRYLICDCGLKLDPALVSNYWSHLESVGDDHALATQQFRALAGQVWPLGFYGDEAAMGLVNAPTNQIFGLYINFPLYRPRSTRLSRFLVFSVESDKIVSMEKTVFPALEAIKESFNLLTSVGVGGVRFLVSELRGDQVFFRSLFKHKSWWKAKNICFRCRAHAGPGSLNYCTYPERVNDGWKATERTTHEFLTEEMPHIDPCNLALGPHECFCIGTWNGFFDGPLPRFRH